MWHVIVLILKIIGITLLSLLGLLLLLLLAGLLVPVRYRIDTGKQEDIRLRAKVSWFLHIFSVPITYEKGELQVRIKLFGIPIKNLTEDSRKVEKEAKKLAEDAGKGAEDLADAVTKEEEEQASFTKAAGKDWDEGREQADSEEPWEEGRAEDIAGKEPASPKKPPKQKKKFILQRILSAFLEKLKKLKYTICGFCDKIRKGLEKIRDLKEFLMLDSTRAALSLVKGQLLYLLKKLGPRHIRGWIHFGMEDPSLTGEILGGVSVLYAYLPKKLELRPDFQQAVLEGELHIRGHFRGITLVGVAWRLWRDKNIKAVYKKVRSGF